MSPTLLTQTLVNIGHTNATEFTHTLSQLQKELEDTDPLLLLSIMASYGLTVGVGNKGLIHLLQEGTILPSYVELLQALYLRFPFGKFSHQPTAPQVIQSISTHLDNCSKQFSLKRLVQVDQAQSERKQKQILVQEHIRMATQVVRNWGYYDQVRQLAEEMLGPLDDPFQRYHGFMATAAITVFDYMLQNWQNRLTAHWKRLEGVISAITLEETISEYFRAFPEIKDTREQILGEMKKRGATQQQAKVMLISHADLRLLENGIFSVTDISGATGVSKVSVNAILDKFSLTFGDLKDNDIEHFFMDNPVWTRPAIKIGNETYFCVMPQLFFAFLFENILYLVRHDSPLRTKYDNRRSEFLEDKAKKVFQRAFPEASIVANFKWHSASGDQQFESDLIIQLDSFLILVEAKSGRVPPAARRGAAKSLGQTIDSLLVEPSRQSQRLEQMISATKRGEAGTRRFAESFPIDLDNIHQILRLSVTLEDFAFLQTNVNGLKGAGYVPDDLHLAPAVTLTDLDVIFEILETRIERVHYLVQRSEWEGKFDYVADEIDLLGTYLETGLSLNSKKMKGEKLILVGASEIVDNYWQCKVAGVSCERPRRQMSQWWRDILQRLETVKTRQWLEAGVVLAYANLQLQKELERKSRSISKKTKVRGRRVGKVEHIVVIPTEEGAEAIGILLVTSDEIERRGELIKLLVESVYAEYPQVERCTIMVLDVDNPLYPYGTLAWSTKSEPIG